MQKLLLIAAALALAGCGTPSERATYDKISAEVSGAAARPAMVRARTRYPSTGNRKRSGPLGRTFEWKVRSSGP